MNGDLPNFDTLATMAKDDPEAFEQLRREKIQEVLDQAPDHMRRRLEGLQFQIDAKRQASSNPMSTCITISRMMHESFERLRDALNNSFSDSPIALDEPEVLDSAQIIAFKSPALAR